MRLDELFDTKKELAKLSRLPDATVEHIKRLITKAASYKRGPNDDDIPDDWDSALELVHWAFDASEVERPAPSQKETWKQYVNILQHAVRMLSRFRGLDGDWRSSSSNHNLT